MVFWNKENPEKSTGDASTAPTPAAPSAPSQALSNERIEPKAKATDAPLLVQPGVVMFCLSAPMFARAYILYHSSLEDMFEKIARKNQIPVQQVNKEADITVRRAAGMAVAGRAFKLASLLSFGSFGLLGSGKLDIVCFCRKRE